MIQRSYTFAFFAVNNLLLLCCGYVNVFKNRKIWLIFRACSNIGQAFLWTQSGCFAYENTTVLLS